MKRSSIDEFFAPLPNGGQMQTRVVPDALGEFALVAAMANLAGTNRIVSRDRSYLGAGAYRRFVPALVRYVLSRPEFYAPYALSHSEVHQGTLEALYEYQSLLATLTGMECVNSSLYDGASACAEAVLLAKRVTKRGDVVVSGALHPEVRDVIRTYAYGHRVQVREAPFSRVTGTTSRETIAAQLDERVCVVVVQYPNVLGVIEDLAPLAEQVHATGALLIVYADLVALALLKPPGDLGADIVVGEAQSLGLPVACGGPSLGYFATRMAYLDEIPGVIVEVCRDAVGRRGFAVRDYRARDRSLLREHAVSNVGTTSTLPAIAVAAYLAALGPRGFRQIAELSYHRTHYLAQRLSAIPGCRLRFSAPFYSEVTVELPTKAASFANRMRERDFLAGRPIGDWYPGLENCLLLGANECTARGSLDQFVDAWTTELGDTHVPLDAAEVGGHGSVRYD